MQYWTDISRGMKEIPFEFTKVGVNCETYKKGFCPFSDKPTCVCSEGFLEMEKKGCLKVLEHKENETMGII